MAKLETNNSTEENIWTCDCYGGYLRISWDDQDSPTGWLFIEHYDSHPSFIKKIKGAWSVLKGQDYPSSEIIFGEAQINSLLDWLYSKSGIQHNREEVLDITNVLTQQQKDVIKGN